MDCKKCDIQREKFKTFLELTTDGYWEWDLQNPEYQYYSPRFKKMLGYEDHELENVPETWRNLIHPDDLPLALCNYENHKDDPNHRYYQKVRYIHKHGHIVNIICRGAIIKDEDGTPISMLGSHTNITEMVNKEDHLETERDKALELSKLTKLFLANMSHEIRTPMNSIVVLTELMLKDKRMSVKHKDYLKCIDSSAEVLMGLLDDILEYSKLESLRLSLNNQKCYLEEIKKNVFNTWSEKIKNKCVEFNVRLSKSAPKYVIIDKQRFFQIMNILISNSYKYTNNGKISVYISCDNDRLKVRVHDSGKGIPEDEYKKIFNPFHRGSNVPTNNGSGIGLSIAKSIVDKIEGDIWFKSAKDEGTKFYFTYPYKNNTINIKEKKTDKVRKISNDQSLNVLIVDDNKVNQYILKELFNEKFPNILYDVAESGEDSIECVKNKKYDMIFMDIVMPGIDGIEATARIREIDTDVYIVAQTANAISGDKEKYICIMDDYISKPIRTDDLKEIFDRFRKQSSL